MNQDAVVPLSILLVDDDDIIRLTGKALLENSGHRVTCCASGHDALDATAHAVFDAILMDINMPDMPGVEAARQIKTRGKHANCPIIALTANATPGEREAYRQAGLDSILIKPLRRGNIERLLADIIARRPTSTPNSKRSGGEQWGAVIDRERLQLLADALPRPKVRELLQQASRSMVETAAILRQAWHDRDRARMADAAHRLTGAAGNFGCESLANLTGKIESDCKSSDIGHSLPQQFEEIFQATLAALLREWEDER